jgi:hypothetical protein
VVERNRPRDYAGSIIESFGLPSGQHPADSQDDIALGILHLAGSELKLEPIDPAHLAVVFEGLAQANRQIGASFLRMTKSRLLPPL